MLCFCGNVMFMEEIHAGKHKALILKRVRNLCDSARVSVISNCTIPVTNSPPDKILVIIPVSLCCHDLQYILQVNGHE